MTDKKPQTKEDKYAKRKRLIQDALNGSAKKETSFTTAVSVAVSQRTTDTVPESQKSKNAATEQAAKDQAEKEAKAEEKRQRAIAMSMASVMRRF